MFEEATSVFIDAAKQSGPFMVLILGICGIVGWNMLKMYRDERDENKRTSDARIADGLAMQAIIKENNTLMVTMGNTIQNQQASIERNTAQIAQLDNRISNLKGGV